MKDDVSVPSMSFSKTWCLQSYPRPLEQKFPISQILWWLTSQLENVATTTLPYKCFAHRKCFMSNSYYHVMGKCEKCQYNTVASSRKITGVDVLDGFCMPFPSSSSTLQPSMNSCPRAPLSLNVARFVQGLICKSRNSVVDIHQLRALWIFKLTALSELAGWR